MKNYQTEFLSEYINNLRISRTISRLAYQTGNALYLNNQCVLQSREGEHFAYTVEDNYQDFHTDIFFDFSDKKVEMQCNCNAEGYCSHKVSALLQLHEDLSQELNEKPKVGMKYTRDGMITRVMAEREEKAKNESFQLDFADNIYGEHLITNQQNRSYKLTFYDFDKEQGYCSCPDHRTNKLGTCKHLIYAFDTFKNQYSNKPIPAQDFPFLEIFLHPLKDYRIAWFYPGKLDQEMKALLQPYFKEEQFVSSKNLIGFHSFLKEAEKHKFIKIRPEVISKIQKEADKQSLIDLKSNTQLDYNKTDISLYPYQKEGVEFIVFRKGALLADEVGLGKTIQAIVAAKFKKDLFNLQSALIVCPDSLIQHWEQEIQKMGSESCLIAKESADLFDITVYFKIIGFDDFARLSFVFDNYAPDFLIIDEAQKISNFDSDLVRIIRRVKRRHLLIITDSKPENHLMQFYTMVGLVDDTALTPLWEFSYQHCLFDSQVLDKITGYYNQETIPRRIDSILLRREKEDVISQLQKINRLIVPVNFSESIQEIHQKLIVESLFLLNKKLKTKFGWQNIAQQLNQLKAISSLVFSVKQTNNFSAKLSEFKHFLLEKINFIESDKKLIVFAEKDEGRKQLSRFFKELRIFSEIINPLQSEEEIRTVFNRFKNNNSPSVLILQEGSIDLLPSADVLIYYDLSLDQRAVENRYIYLQQQSAVKPPILVHFLSKDSLEYGLHQLITEKIQVYEEIEEFLLQEDEDAELSREAQNRLKSILQGLLKESNFGIKKDKTGQTLLFPFGDENKTLSLSGEEHKAFERPKIEKVAVDNNLDKLVQDAHSFLSGLYTIQTGKELPWKAEDISLNVSDEEIIFRIKRK